jgi:hypothetical protein
VFDEPWKNVVAIFNNELNDARTVPDVEDVIRAGDSLTALKILREDVSARRRMQGLPGI